MIPYGAISESRNSCQYAEPAAEPRIGIEQGRVMAFERVQLGRTGFSVTRLGIASSYGTDEAMVEEAVARGVNYLYWGALRTRRMAEGITRVARRNRDDLIIVVHTMARTVPSIDRVVHKSMKRLGVDYLDVLLLGMGGYPQGPGSRLIEHADKLKDDGVIRALAISSHHRLLFPELEKERHFDIFHVRYNAAHRGAEDEVFSGLPKVGGPGIVSFTNTRWGSLLNPANMPPGESPPSAADCYRFVLSHPHVHVAVCGPNSMTQLKEDLTALEIGPLSNEEMQRMRRIGNSVYEKESPLKAQLKSIKSITWRRKQ
jgi:aryl-alcohol dehydrogenase-like predicted oxidoreductase